MVCVQQAGADLQSSLSHRPQLSIMVESHRELCSSGFCLGGNMFTLTSVTRGQRGQRGQKEWPSQIWWCSSTQKFHCEITKSLDCGVDGSTCVMERVGCCRVTAVTWSFLCSVSVCISVLVWSTYGVLLFSISGKIVFYSTYLETEVWLLFWPHCFFFPFIIPQHFYHILCSKSLTWI